jgi:hypothetical protein
MKKIFIFLILLFVSGITQEASMISLADQQTPSDSSKIQRIAAVENLELNDFKKFYIGFATSNEALEVITLDIKNIAESDSGLTFHYTMNTHDNRQDGIGEIFPGRSIISFQNMEQGKISIPEDGKIVFESVAQDSLNYWKLKEK